MVPEIKAELFAVPGGADFATYVVGTQSSISQVQAANNFLNSTATYTGHLVGKKHGHPPLLQVRARDVRGCREDESSADLATGAYRQVHH